MQLKKLFLALSMTTVIVSPGVSFAATVAESVTTALSSNPAMKAGKASTDAADQGVREQKAAFFPTLNMNASTARVHQNDDTTRAATGGYVTAGVYQGTVSLTQPIFAGWGNLNRYEAAKARKESAEQDLGGAAEDVALRAARAHLNLMRTKELLAEASDYLKAIQKRKDNIELMVKKGAGDTADLLQAERVLLSAKSTQLDYQNAFQQANAEYFEVVGSEPDSSLTFGARDWEKAVPLSLDDAVTVAIADNPNIKSADRLVTALGKEADAQGADLFPRVDAEVSHTDKAQSNDMGGQMISTQALLKASWSFSTGGAQLARISKGLSEREAAVARHEDTKRGVERDVRQRFNAMQILDEQYALMKEGEDAADKMMKTFTDQFEAGKQSNLQLINAQARLFEARAGRIDSYFRSVLARFELLNAMGKLQAAITGETVISPVSADIKEAEAQASALAAEQAPKTEPPALPVAAAPEKKAEAKASETKPAKKKSKSKSKVKAKKQ